MRSTKTVLVFILTMSVTWLFACSRTRTDARTGEPSPAISTDSPDSLRLKVTVGANVLYTGFSDNPTTRDFIKLLPLALEMDDLKGREKYSGLPRNLSKEGPVKTTFREGDIAYWLGGGLAVFYRQDSSIIKAGLVVIANLGNELEAFNGPGSLNVKFEAVEKN